jgi:hypothetical protein
MQVMEQLGSASGCPIQFFGYRERPSSGGLTTVCASRKKYDTPHRPWGCVIPLCETWRNDLGDYPLWTDHAIWMLHFGNGMNGNVGKFLRFWNRKCIKWVKKLFHCQICYFLGGKFSYVGMYWKGNM